MSTLIKLTKKRGENRYWWVKMKNITKFQDIFGDSVRVKILEFYLEADKVSFPVEAAIEDKEIGKSQAYEIIKDFLDKKLLIKDIVYNRKQFYKLNPRNSIIKSIRSAFKRILISS